MLFGCQNSPKVAFGLTAEAQGCVLAVDTAEDIRGGGLGIEDGLDGTVRGYQGHIMGEPLSPNRVFDFLVDELEPHPAYDFFAPGPLPGYAGNPNNNNGWIEADMSLLRELGVVVNELMVGPIVDEIAER
ncbi:hypothetical protein Tco_0307730 [Tanacetum coccineum]